MEKGIFKTLEKIEEANTTQQNINLLWAWKNQPPIMQWWFALSGISIMAVYFVLLIKL